MTMRPEELIARACSERHPLAAARHLERFSPRTMAAAVVAWPPLLAASVLRYLLAPVGAAVLRELPPEMTVPILVSYPTPLRLAVLRQIPRGEREPLIELLEEQVGGGLGQSLAFAEDTAGSLADPLAFVAAPDWRADETLERLKSTSRTVTYYVYAVDRDGRLAGVVTIKELLAADAERPVSALMRSAPRSLPAEAREEAVRRHPYWREHPILPVVDRAGHFVGVLRYRALKQHADATAVRHEGAPISASLIGLWELYTRTSLGVMTDVGTLLRSEGAGGDQMPGDDR